MGRVTQAMAMIGILGTCDHFDGTVTGVVSYGFGVYKVLTMANKLPQLIDGGLKPEKAQLTPAQDKLLLASYKFLTSECPVFFCSKADYHGCGVIGVTTPKV